jgi:hypothetical protein
MVKMMFILYLLKLDCLNNVIYGHYLRKVNHLVYVHYLILELIKVGSLFRLIFIFRFYLAWVNATQAFMLMAYIIGILILIVIVVFRREFLHNGAGYIAERIAQPTFTYMIAGLILFFCCKASFFS